MPIAYNKETGKALFLNQSGQWLPAQTAINPETGEKLAFDGSQWQKIKTKEIAAEEKPLLQRIHEGFSGFTDEALNTATFGLSDKVAGAGEALSSLLVGDGDTEKAFNAPRERREEFRKENPVSSTVAGVIGGLANPVGQKVGSIIAKGEGLLSTTLRGAAGGGGLTGAQALGESHGDFEERAGQVGEAVAIGTAFGGVLPGAIAGVKGGFNGILSLLTRFSSKVQGTKALRKVAEALERDGFTPKQALERIDKLGPEAALLDVGENTRALAFSASGIPGKGKTTITKFLRDRQEGVRDPVTGVVRGGQVQRVQDHIDGLVPENFFNQRQQLANINKSAELYDAAYAANQNIESKVVDGILKTPSGRQAFKNARTTIQDLRKNVSKVDPELTAQAKESGTVTGRGVGRGLKLEFLDKVKQELYDLEQAAKTQFGKATSKSDAITRLRRDLIKELDNIDAKSGGNYAKARALAGDKLGNQEALERGAEFMSKARFSSPEELGIALQEMTPEARHLFRVGAAQALKAKIADVVSRADATKKLIDIQTLERKILQAFGDKKLFKSYTDFLENEKELFRAVTDVLSNSKTAARQASLDDAAIDPSRLLQGVRDLTSGAPGGLTRGVINIAGGVKDRLTIPPNQSEALSRVLTGKNIKGLENIVPELTPITQGGGPRSLEESLIRAFSSGEGALLSEAPRVR